MHCKEWIKIFLHILLINSQINVLPILNKCWMSDLNLRLVSQFLKLKIRHKEGLTLEDTSVSNRFQQTCIHFKKKCSLVQINIHLQFVYSEPLSRIFIQKQNCSYLYYWRNKFLKVLIKWGILFFICSSSKLVMYWSNEKQSEELSSQ